MKLHFFLLLFGFTAFAQELALDSSFGTNGYSVNSETDLVESFNEIVQQSDGKIIANCNYNVADGTATRKQIVILRYNQNGILDNSFGTNGRYYISNSTYRERRSFIKVLGNDRILVAYTSGLNTSDYTLIRLNSDGTLDATFGVEGYVNTDVLLSDEAHALEVQADNKILLVGRSDNGLATIRYDENGIIDSSFGINGIYTHHVGYNNSTSASNDYFYSVGFQSDGKIVLAGITDANAAPEQWRFVLLRLNTNGTLDETFGTNGNTISAFLGTIVGSPKIVIKAADEILAVGTSFYANDNYKIRVAKYQSNGTLSNDFGNNGVVELQLTENVSLDYMFDIELLFDGKMIIGGGTNAFPNRSTLLAKLNENGSFDTSFSSDGIFTIDISAMPGAAIYDAVVLPNGYILIGGIIVGDASGTYDSFVARLLPQTLVNMEFKGNSFSITPNPTNQFLNLNSENNQSIEKILVSDLQGKIIINQSGNLSQINVQNIQQGLYFIQIQSQGKTYTQKFIKE